MNRTKTIGLALSGGGVRGFAHVGVLKVLEREAIPIHFLAGTSMGGFIAAAYAAGRSAAQIEAEIHHLSTPRHLLPMLDRSPRRRGLLLTESIMGHLAQWLENPDFADLKQPLALVAVDLNNGQRVALQDGSVMEAIRATGALPGLFPPVIKDNMLLVDGGLLDNLPADVAREMGADLVLAVDVTTDLATVDVIAQNLQRHPLIPDGLTKLIEVLNRSLIVLMQHANQHSLAAGRPDLIIRPAIPAGVTVLTGFNRTEEIINAGEQAAIKVLPIINSLFGGGRSQ